MNMAQSDASDSDQSDDMPNFYSGAAKRYKKEVKVVYPTGIMKLVNKKDDSYPSSARKTSPARVQQVDDSSDEEIFKNDLDAEEIEENKDDDLDQSNLINPKQQVETLEEIEDYIVHLSPENSFTNIQENTNSASLQDDIEEVEFEEDPLFCAPLNDSELNQSLHDDEKMVVKVRFIQKVWRIELKRADYFKSISQKLAESTGVEAAKIGLYFNNRLLDHYDSLKTVDIRITDIIDATVCNEGITAAAASDENMLEFKVQTSSRNSQVVVSIRAEDPMSVLMQKYADATNNDLSKLTFKLDGDILDEDDTPTSLDLEGGECIDVFIKE